MLASCHPTLDLWSRSIDPTRNSELLSFPTISFQRTVTAFPSLTFLSYSPRNNVISCFTERDGRFQNACTCAFRISKRCTKFAVPEESTRVSRVLRFGRHERSDKEVNRLLIGILSIRCYIILFASMVRGRWENEMKTYKLPKNLLVLLFTTINGWNIKIDYKFMLLQNLQETIHHVGESEMIRILHSWNTNSCNI